MAVQPINEMAIQTIGDMTGISGDLDTNDAHRLLQAVMADKSPEQVLQEGDFVNRLKTGESFLDSALQRMVALDTGTASRAQHSLALQDIRKGVDALVAPLELVTISTQARAHAKDAYRLAQDAVVAFSGIPLQPSKDLYHASAGPVREQITAIASGLPSDVHELQEMRGSLQRASQELGRLEIGRGSLDSTGNAFSSVEAAEAVLHSWELTHKKHRLPDVRATMAELQTAMSGIRVEPAVAADTSAARTILESARSRVRNAIELIERGGGIASEVEFLLEKLLQETNAPRTIIRAIT